MNPSSSPLSLKREGFRLAVPLMAAAFISLFASLSVQLIYLLAARLLPAASQQAWFPWVSSSLAMYAIAMPLSLLFFALEAPTPPAKKRLSIPALLGLVAICFALSLAGNWVGIAVTRLMELITGIPSANEIENLTLSSPLWANLLCAGILAPVMEELVYRKLVIDRLLPLGELPAVLISGLIFGLIHGNLSQLFYATVIGILLGYVYVRTGNILYTVGLHMCVNLVGGVYSAEILKLLGVTSLSQLTPDMLSHALPGLILLALYWLFMGGCLIGAVIAVIFLWKRVLFAKPPHGLTAGQWTRLFICNPAVWLFCAMMLLMFLG